MANYDQQNYNNWNSNQQQSYNFEMPEQFGSELNFQTFDATQNVDPNSGIYANTSYNNTYYDPTAYAAPDPIYDGTTSDFDNEPPLLEELGINPNHILQKTLSVLNPFRTTDQTILQDTDLAGPLVFCLTLGSFLLLSGKVHFSYIYGIGVLGCLAFFALLSVMATQASVTVGAVVSVLGYCLLPMVLLSGINVILTIQGIFGMLLAGLCILWCSISASKLFVTAYSMDHQQILIAYPCALLYGVFALITIF
ncbi:protein YIPF5 [Sitodiplosis mosellana]|uniref:protein YIPF5 n=1 Tax=Sitodiplosis mosellana TaxID=263140 RepID=UPI00244390F7|nr:protein YIPF5 [Sitodiplosis mosellana]